MRILIIGSGGREHALAQAMQTHELFVAPGNAGTAEIATNADCDIQNPLEVVHVAREVEADLVVIGPEIPLVAGASDALREAGFSTFGPTQAAAQLEGSKAFAKDVMSAAGVATAYAERILEAGEIDTVLDNFGPNYVVKDDGLAGGKGVVVTRERDAAAEHAREVIAGGNPVLVESFLDGPEVSLFCLVDGETVVPLIPAQDHKRAYDNDEGPNTGGMGAYCPLPWLPEGGVQRIVDEVVAPVAREMVSRGIPYSGLLYAGIAWGEQGPSVVEFNARFGDPETQAVLALLESDLAEALLATAEGRLAELPQLEWRDGAAITVVLAAQDYPAAPVIGGEIHGAEHVLHAGTALDDEGRLISSGGRVLNVVGVGADLGAARADAYAQIEQIELEGSFYRRDIGQRALDGEITV
ncbi:phosphoribosylamine--glycine ligase [Corynebacterium pilosum]|uniref:Phosphoribosylamine--glycine ligase n=1 Tax=Corynebacterium pilosum TaxID=35756 RepID=A0A376CK53_9CORY|nr:phosphoribosylamine--glycine ligase [Corynebacterium pilosum]STC68804.1 phosphoribosylamine-glycine ligase [Corynebacterium pilosum]